MIPFRPTKDYENIIMVFGAFWVIFVIMLIIIYPQKIFGPYIFDHPKSVIIIPIVEISFAYILYRAISIIDI